MSDIQLFQGDCLEVMQQIPSNSVDMILCDLPYGTTKNKWEQLYRLMNCGKIITE